VEWLTHFTRERVTARIVSSRNSFTKKAFLMCARSRDKNVQMVDFFFSRKLSSIEQ
jgi:hypothetical protein